MHSQLIFLFGYLRRGNSWFISEAIIFNAKQKTDKRLANMQYSFCLWLNGWAFFLNSHFFIHVWSVVILKLRSQFLRCNRKWTNNFFLSQNCPFTCFTIYNYRKKLNFLFFFVAKWTRFNCNFFLRRNVQKNDNANRCRMQGDLKRLDWNEHMVQHERTLCTRMDNRRIDGLESHKQCVCAQQLRWAMNQKNVTIINNNNN